MLLDFCIHSARGSWSQSLLGFSWTAHSRCDVLFRIRSNGLKRNKGCTLNFSHFFNFRVLRSCVHYLLHCCTFRKCNCFFRNQCWGWSSLYEPCFAVLSSVLKSHCITLSLALDSSLFGDRGTFPLEVHSTKFMEWVGWQMNLSFTSCHSLRNKFKLYPSLKRRVHLRTLLEEFQKCFSSHETHNVRARAPP